MFGFYLLKNRVDIIINVIIEMKRIIKIICELLILWFRFVDLIVNFALSLLLLIKTNNNLINIYFYDVIENI